MTRLEEHERAASIDAAALRLRAPVGTALDSAQRQVVAGLQHRATASLQCGNRQA